MNPLEGLAQYLDRLERRLRLFTWTRGAAVIIGAALALTVAIVAALYWSAFTPTGLILGRFVLFLGIGAAVALTLIVPLMRMNRRRAAQQVEQQHPGFDQRLLTFTERARDNAADPFLPLLAADALEIARDAQPDQLIHKGVIIRFASIAAAAASVLIWLMFWGPGVFGYGTALLWGNFPKEQSKSFFRLTVEPGSKTIRRKSDQMISAHTNGFMASKASLFVRYASAPKWEEVGMDQLPAGAGFGFLLVGVPEDADYYVAAAGLKSDIYKLHTIDLPAVKNISVTYVYPSWTGLASNTENPGGDLRAVEGTVAKLEIETDRPLSGAQLLMEGANPVGLDATSGNKTHASVTIDKDGSYHLGVMDHGEMVRLTDDYFIEARKVSPPVVRITKPGRDAKVSPIEEVEVRVEGEDEYPLQEANLHYSVNGGPDKTVSLLKEKGAKKIQGSTLLSMEDFKAVPGDVVSIYATVKDGKNSAQTDMYFIQAVPFEFNYTQSQQSGGGGGGMGGEQEQQISEREKEIIAATFNQVKGDAKAKASAAENGKYLSEVQAKLRDQAQSLANRTKARQLDTNGAGFSQFVKEMEAAVAAMTPASDKLKTLSFQDALAPEQQALQHLLRAESTFRDIQIQITRGGGGGGGGGGGAGRDLANLFDLELDKDKNQYETNNGAGSAAEQQKQQQIDDAMKKLADLARRQQELAEQQKNNPQQIAQQRWEQEQLRREAEQLKRDMQQLKDDQQQNAQAQQGQQNQQGQQGQQSQQGQPGQQGQQGQQSQSSASSGQSGQSGQQSARGQQQQQQLSRNQTPQQRQSQQQLDQAIRDLEQATRDMSSAASARQPGQQPQQNNAQSQSEAQRAAERLKQAGQTLQSMRNAQNGSQMSDLANKAARLAEEQQDFEQRMRRNFGQGQQNPQVAQQMADEKKQMHEAYDQLQKDMQNASRSFAGTEPDVAKGLRESMGKSQQDEVQSRMDRVESALRQGMGQYAVMYEPPVTRSLNELKDDLQKLEASAGKQEGGDDKGHIATQQALDRLENARRAVEQLARSAQAQAGNRGNQPGQRGQQPGQQQGQQGQNGQQQGQGRQPGQNGQQGDQQQQARNGQQGGQQGQQGQQGGQQGQQGQQGGQQGQQGQGGQQGGGQQAGNSPSGSPNNQGGGNGKYAGGPRTGGNIGGLGTWNGGGWNGDPWQGDTRRLNGGAPDPQASNQTPAQAAAGYEQAMRDLQRLRGQIGDDKGLMRDYQALMRQMQDLDPKRLGTDPRLSEVINGQILNAIDEVELQLRRKMEANDGSVRSASPDKIPAGYADAVAEYRRRLSRQ